MALSGSTCSSVLFREVHKNAWLRRLPVNDKKTGANPKKGERVWAVFCVHDDVEPFLELYNDQKVAIAHKPEWCMSLANTLHISPTICPQDDEFEFVVTLPDNIVRLTASSWEVMMEWVDSIGTKLREMRILSPKENVYSRMPETRAPLLPTRDPNSPLPLPPVGPLAVVPGVEPLSTSDSQNGHNEVSSERHPNSSNNNIPNEDPVVTPSTSTPVVYTSRPENSPSVYASPSTSSATSQSPTQQNITVIQVKSDAFNFNSLGESLPEETRSREVIEDEDRGYEDAFSSPLTVTPILPRIPNHPQRNSPVCSSSQNESSPVLTPRGVAVRRHQTVSNSQPRVVPDELNVARIEASVSSELSIEQPVNNSTNSSGALYEHVFLSTNQQIPTTSPVDSTEARPIVQDTSATVVGPARCRSGLRPPKRRSGDSVPASTGSNERPVAVDRIRRLQPPPHPFRQNQVAQCDTTGMSRLTLREQQVLQLRREMMHPGGVRLQLRRKDCLGSIALVDVFGAVWVAGWKQKDHPMLYNALHIGDQVISVAGVRVQSSADAQKLIRGAPSLYVAFVIRRVPFGRVYALKRESEGQTLGLIQEGGTAEIKDVIAGGLAAAHGLPARTPSIDGLSLNTWFLTEINGRPLNLFFKENEVRDRLNALGMDISLLVQPSDLIKQIKKQLKAIRSYKDYIVQ